MRAEWVLVRPILNFRRKVKLCAHFSSSTAKAYHSNLVKDGSITTLLASNHLLSLYVKGRDLESASKLFDEIPDRDVRSWTTLISGFARYGHHKIGIDYFSEMRKEGMVIPNAFTLSVILKCCVHLISSGGLLTGKSVHGWSVRNGIEADVALNNAFLDLYAKSGGSDYLRRFFDSMGCKDAISWNIMMSTILNRSDVLESLEFFKSLPVKSVASWNTIIDGLLQRGFEKHALDLIYEMVGIGQSFNEVTFSIALVLASSLKSLELGKQIHGQLLRVGLNKDSFVRTSLLDMYRKCGKMDKSSLVFKEFLLEVSVDDDDLMAQTVSWSTMIAGYVQHGMTKEALLCFQSMIRKNVNLDDPFTLSTIITASADASLLLLGQQLHAHTMKLGHEKDIVLRSSVIDMYAKCGKLDDSVSIFRQTLTKNIVLWTAMITSYAMHGLGREANRLFEAMQDEGIAPNEVTFISVLTACSHGGLVKDGCKYFKMMIEVYKMHPNIEHLTCMVDLLGRGGHLREINSFIYENGIFHLKEVWKCYLSSCGIHKNSEMIDSISKKLLELEPLEADSYVLVSNSLSGNSSWKDAEKWVASLSRAYQSSFTRERDHGNSTSTQHS